MTAAAPTFISLAGENLEWCPRCTTLYRVGQWATCGRRGDPSEHGAFVLVKFQEFTFDSDEGPILIDSVEKLRKVERESMERYQAGRAGDPRFARARPFVFRQYSQHRGNRTDEIEILPHPEQIPRQLRERRERRERGGSR